MTTFLKLVLLLLCVWVLPNCLHAQVVINKKGTIILIDSSKWELNGTTISTKNNVNVGIGVTSPIYRLDVRSTSNPLRIVGLVDGAVTDSLLSVTNGVVKKVAQKNIDTTSLSNRINLKLNKSDTASLSNRINLKLNASDTASLSDRINAKLNIADTASMLSTYVNSVSNGLKKVGKDVSLGGNLVTPTMIGTSAANNLALTGLQSGSFSTDSVLVINGLTNVIRRVSLPAAASNALPAILLSASRISTYTIPVGSNYSTVLYNNATINVGTSYNTTTGVFTAPSSGIYEVIVNNLISKTDGDFFAKNLSLRVVVNGAVEIEVSESLAPSTAMVTSTIVANTKFSLAAGQTITIQTGGANGLITPVFGIGQHTLKIIQIK